MCDVSYASLIVCLCVRMLKLKRAQLPYRGSVGNAVLEYKLALAYPSLHTWPVHSRYMEAVYRASLYVK